MKRAYLIFVFLISFFTLGCGEKNVLNDRFPARIKALFLGIERADLKGKFSKGGLKVIAELFTTTEFQKHKQRVIEKLNELKGAFVETDIFASETLVLYKTKPENKQIFDFYTLGGVDFKKVPYLYDVASGGIDRSFEKIKDQLQSDLILELRPVELKYVEKGSSKRFELKIAVILFDLKAKKIVFNKTVEIESKITKSFYKEAKLKQGESPTPGFQKIRVEFMIENYKEEIQNLAKKAAPEIIKLLIRPDKKKK